MPSLVLLSLSPPTSPTTPTSGSYRRRKQYAWHSSPCLGLTWHLSLQPCVCEVYHFPLEQVTGVSPASLVPCNARTFWEARASCFCSIDRKQDSRDPQRCLGLGLRHFAYICKNMSLGVRKVLVVFIKENTSRA